MNSPNKKTADVVIVGGGCMGAAVAYYLARHGITDVVLLERDETLGTQSTGKNAGGVRHQFSNESNIKLSQESIKVFERFEEEIGYPLDFHQDGYLFLLSSERTEAIFEKNVALQRSMGVEVEWLTPEQAAAKSPGLQIEGIRAATFCGKDGIADPAGVTIGFASAAKKAGVTVREGVEVRGVRTEGNRIVGVDTSDGSIDAPIVVNAAGPWAKVIGEMAGVQIPIEPLRRHIFIAKPPTDAGWVDGSERLAPESYIMVIDFDTTFYFHREGTNILFGMGDPSEPWSFDQTVDMGVLEKIAPVAMTRLPVLVEAPLSHAWAGLYEMSPDAMPIIGPVSGLDGMYLIGGFSGHGFQHAPASGRIIADLIAGKTPDHDLSFFAYERLLSGQRVGEKNVV